MSQTNGDLLCRTLAVSVALHLLFLIVAKESASLTDAVGRYIQVDLTSTEILISKGTNNISLGSISQGQADAKKAAEKRRQIYNQYIEEVAREIHSRRLDFGHKDLIGLAAFSFSIQSDGKFTDIKLRKSSGLPQLDNVARLAIEASSEKVKRPKELGGNVLFVFQEVRFQYNLR